MRTDGHRRSENFEDRGAGSVRGGGGRAATRLLGLVVRRFGIKGLLVAGLGLAGVYFFAPASIQRAVFGGSGSSSGAVAGSVCAASEANTAACDFSRVVLASTEDVWAAQFAQGRLPAYGGALPRRYQNPTLVVFANSVATGGCGNVSSDVGPFYCPADHRLYIDPSFYETMAHRLRAPGDFAQAYVIAHEVGHHVQNLIGAKSVSVRGDTDAQASVRIELMADCLAGVWGHTARASLQITDEDLAEAVQAAHAIGDDTLGHRDRARFTHGSSEQRIRWFRRGFDSGDARQCDTLSVADPNRL